jgi:hypothetical protein
VTRHQKLKLPWDDTTCLTAFPASIYSTDVVPAQVLLLLCHGRIPVGRHWEARLLHCPDKPALGHLTVYTGRQQHVPHNQLLAKLGTLAVCLQPLENFLQGGPGKGKVLAGRQAGTRWDWLDTKADFEKTGRQAVRLQVVADIL